MNNKLQINARFDRKYITQETTHPHYLIIDAISAAVNPDLRRPEIPLNIALVIDGSGSMSGDRLLFAKKAATDIVERLCDRDRISVVSFSETATVHIDGISCDAAGRKAAINAIDAIRTGGCTNLSEGWMKGAECLTVVKNEYPNLVSSLIILSDGHANRGIVDPATLARDAGKLQMNGISSSAAGIGDDYSTEQLMAIAMNGGGTLHHAPEPNEIVEVVMGELDGLRTRVIENLSLSIDFPSDVTVELLGLSPCKFNGSNMTCFLGGLTGGASRSIVLRVQVPQSLRTNALRFEVNAHWREPGGAETLSSAPCSATLMVAGDTASSGDGVDKEAGLEIAGIWEAYVVWKVTNLNRAQDFNRLNKFIAQELSEIRAFCALIPEAMPLAENVEELGKLAHRNWKEDQRKEMQQSSYLASQRRQDKRSRGTKDWKDHLKPQSGSSK